MTFTNATQYVNAMGVGLDTNGTEYANIARQYDKNPKIYQIIRDRGFKHVRLRVQEDPVAASVANIRKHIQQALDADLLPVLAYQAGPVEEDPSPIKIDAFLSWWDNATEICKDFSNKLAFNLIVEIGKPLAERPALVNEMYKSAIARIRQTQGDRVIFCAPVNLSSPLALGSLVLPEDDLFLAIEAHFIAAGVNRINTKSDAYYEPNSPDVDQHITRLTTLVDLMTADRENRGYPIWNGAMMLGGLPIVQTDRGEYTIEEGVELTKILVAAHKKYGIPYAWNAEKHLLNLETGEWIEKYSPIVDAMF